MSSIGLWIPASVLGAVALASLFGAVRFLGRARVIEDTPTARIRSAPQGYVELQGQARPLPGPPIVSPLSGAPCVWYRYKIEELATHANGDRRWRTIQKGSSDDLFLLVDETGECIVDPQGAHISPEFERVWYDVPTGAGLPSGLLGLLSRTTRGARRRFTEKRLRVGEPLYALGLFRTVGGAAETLDTPALTRDLVRLWKQDRARLFARFDSNRDGELDMQEWETVRHAARDEVVRRQTEYGSRPPAHLLSATEDGRPYLLSALPQQHLARRFRLYAGLSSLAFVLIAAGAAWLMAQGA